MSTNPKIFQIFLFSWLHNYFLKNPLFCQLSFWKSLFVKKKKIKRRNLMLKIAIVPTYLQQWVKCSHSLGTTAIVYRQYTILNYWFREPARSSSVKNRPTLQYIHYAYLYTGTRLRTVDYSILSLHFLWLLR